MKPTGVPGPPNSVPDVAAELADRLAELDDLTTPVATPGLLGAHVGVARHAALLSAEQPGAGYCSCEHRLLVGDPAGVVPVQDKVSFDISDRDFSRQLDRSSAVRLAG